MDYNRSKPWIRRIFSGRNGLIMALTAAAFVTLNVYRMNDPLPIGNKIPNFSLQTQEGLKFDISEIKMPVVIVFYQKHKAFSNYIFNSVYRKMLPELKFLQDKNYAQVIVLTDGYDTPEKVAELSKDNKHTALQTIGYAADTRKIAKLFGIRSRPHLFVVDSSGIVIYEAKLTSVNHIKQILWRD